MNEETAFRVILVVVFVSALLISGSFRRKARQSGETISRKAEGGTALFLRMGAALIFFGSIVLYAVAPEAMSWASLEIPSWLRWLGAGIALSCLPLLWWVFNSIGNNISETVLTKKDHQLVMSGPYRWVRHPLYAVALLMFFSLGLMAASWLITVYALIGAVIFRLGVIPKEEEQLIQAFGDDYQDYRGQTGAMVPKFSS